MREEVENKIKELKAKHLGPDVIGDQFNIMNFTIDLMISRCKIV